MLTGEKSGATGTISEISKKPVRNLKNYKTIQSNTDFGFILNLYENY
jgi:hypothetical protein